MPFQLHHKVVVGWWIFDNFGLWLRYGYESLINGFDAKAKNTDTTETKFINTLTLYCHCHIQASTVTFSSLCRNSPQNSQDPTLSITSTFQISCPYPSLFSLPGVRKQLTMTKIDIDHIVCVASVVYSLIVWPINTRIFHIVTLEKLVQKMSECMNQTSVRSINF